MKFAHARDLYRSGVCETKALKREMLDIKSENFVNDTKMIGTFDVSKWEENIKNLKDEGRVQFFYHCPNSKLPVRDVLNKQHKGHKTEPHLEIGAENFLSDCYQSNNIIPFLNNREKYLFLMTTCRNQELRDHYGKRFIVGYIVKENYTKNITKDGQEIFGVKGSTYIFSFDDSIPIEKLGYNRNIRVKKVNRKDTELILSYFKNRTNILQRCVDEIKNLDRERKTCDRERCSYQNQCLRLHEV